MHGLAYKAHIKKDGKGAGSGSREDVLLNKHIPEICIIISGADESIKIQIDCKELLYKINDIWILGNVMKNDKHIMIG
jgi:hypothetical protein